MLAKTLTISDKGQIVIPKAFVKYLGSNVIKLEMTANHEVKITPIKDVAGMLTSSAKKSNTDDFSIIRQQAWDQAIEEKFGKAKALSQSEEYLDGYKHHSFQSM